MNFWSGGGGRLVEKYFLIGNHPLVFLIDSSRRMSGAGVSETGKSTQGSFDGSIVGAENSLDLFFSFFYFIRGFEGSFSVFGGDIWKAGHLCWRIVAYTSE